MSIASEKLVKGIVKGALSTDYYQYLCDECGVAVSCDHRALGGIMAASRAPTDRRQVWTRLIAAGVCANLRDWKGLLGAKVNISSPALLWIWTSLPAAWLTPKKTSSTFWLELVLGGQGHPSTVNRH